MDEALVHAVLNDWRAAPVNARLHAALGFLEKLTLGPDTVTRADLDEPRAAGLSRRAIEEAAYVAFLFGVMDRLADAFDFTIPNEKELEANGDFLYKRGYKLAKLIR